MLVAGKQAIQVSSDRYQISKSALKSVIFNGVDSIFVKSINKSYYDLGYTLKSSSAGQRIYQKRGFSENFDLTLVDKVIVTEHYTFLEFVLEAKVVCKAYSSTYHFVVEGDDQVGSISCAFRIDSRASIEKMNRFREMERSRLLDLNANIQSMLNAQLAYDLNLHGARTYESGRDSEDLLIESKFNARQIGGFGMNSVFKHRFLSISEKLDQPFTRSTPTSGSPIMRSKSSDLPANSPPVIRPCIRSKSSEVLSDQGNEKEPTIPVLPKRVETRKYKSQSSSSDGSLTPPVQRDSKNKKPLIPQVILPDPNPDFKLALPRSPPNVPSKPKKSSSRSRSSPKKILCPGGIARFVPSKSHQTSLHTLLYLLIQLAMVLYLSTDLDQLELSILFKKVWE